MTKEDKELLLKDLCARLPYRVKAKYYDPEAERTTCDEIDDVYCTTSIHNVEIGIGQYGLHLTEVKPYLFPMSSMTEEQCEELYAISEVQLTFTPDIRIKVYKNTIEWFLKNHIDYNGLIEKGLAIDATGLEIY